MSQTRKIQKLKQTKRKEKQKRKAKQLQFFLFRQSFMGQCGREGGRKGIKARETQYKAASHVTYKSNKNAKMQACTETGRENVKF